MNAFSLSVFVNEGTSKGDDKNYAGIALTLSALEPFKHTPPPNMKALLC